MTRKFLIEIEDHPGTRWNGQQDELAFYLMEDARKTVAKITTGVTPIVRIAESDFILLSNDVGQLIHIFLDGPEDRLQAAIVAGREMMKRLKKKHDPPQP